jgi:outer membrane protein assembly factor BamD (BamD/ComL family)
MRNPNGAIDTLKRLMSELPDDPLAVEAQARIAGVQLYSLRDFGAARAALRDFMAGHPDYPAMMVVACDLAYCSYDQADYAGAAALFTEVGNYRAMILYMTADCYMRILDFKKAKEQADLLISTYPNEPAAALAVEMYASLTGSWMTGGAQ